MANVSKNPDLVVREVLSFVSSHLAEPVSLTRVAKHAGYSVSRMGKIFKKQTGQSILAHLQYKRLERAKELLGQTNLSITEIAFEVGYASYTRFAIQFKKKTGLSPSSFRESMRNSKEAPLDFGTQAAPRISRTHVREDFEGKKLGDGWKIVEGEWRQENNTLVGNGKEQFTIQYAHPLFENFILTLDFSFVDWDPNTTTLRLMLHGENAATLIHSSVVLGRQGNRTGAFMAGGQERSWNSRGILQPGKWQRLSMKLQDTTVEVKLDNEVLFQFTNPFPASYATRCHFSISGWCGKLTIKELTIQDLGFAPFVPVIRQADSLYNNGIYDSATTTYMRLLSSSTSHIETMEIQYKIGMCLLRQNAFEQARGWFSRVVPLPDNDFWSFQAILGILEADALQREFSSFQKRAAELFEKPDLRDGARSLIERVVAKSTDQGFFDRAISLCEFLVGREEKDSVAQWVSEAKLMDLLFLRRRYGEVEEVGKSAISSPNCPKSVSAGMIYSMATAAAFSGNFEKSGEYLKRFRELCGLSFELARCEILEAVNLRGQRKFDKALSILLRIQNEYRALSDQCGFAARLASQIYCALGETQSARELCHSVEKTYGAAFANSYYPELLYTPALAEARYMDASEVLLTASQTGESHARANRMVRAGILAELSGDVEKARTIWSQAERRFPLEHCNYYALLSGNLPACKEDVLESMPYESLDRSEMFYLAGLLFEKRGTAELAKKYYRLAVDDDPTKCWCAVLAERKLA